jgi:hypothetical protein
MHSAEEARKKAPMWKNCREEAASLLNKKGNNSNSVFLRATRFQQWA